MIESGLRARLRCGSAISVRLHLIAPALVVSVPAVAVIVWLLSALAQQTRDAAAAQVRLSAADAVSRLDVLMRQHEALLERIQERPLVRLLDTRRCDPLLSEHVSMRDEVSELVLFNHLRALMSLPCLSHHRRMKSVNRV